MRAIKLKLAATRSWLLEAKHFWLSTGVIVVALLIALRPGTPEPVIRITGLALQLLGIATVVWGISETRESFGLPSLTSVVKAWLGRFPLLRRTVVLSAVGSALGLAGAKARAYVTQGPGDNPTTETRLSALEKNIQLIHERISATQQEMDAELKKAADALKNEKQVRESEDQGIRTKLEATSTGGVHISAIGALWLFVGVSVSTASVEIAAIIKYAR